jgi:omega-6 fatty acid desaturase (delta-12 desaturase)
MKADDKLAARHLAISLGLFFGLWGLGIAFWDVLAVRLVLVVMMAGVIIRIYITQHDCGHYMHFSSKRVNVFMGVALSAITLNSFKAMVFNHNRHHATVGDLAHRDAHEVMTWTLSEYQAASPISRLGYRAFRHPVVLFGIGALLVFFLRYRFPKNGIRCGVGDVIIQNVLMFGLWALAYALFGWAGFAMVTGSTAFAACFGVLIVYLGHNYEFTYWKADGEYNFQEASLQGSSVLDLGPIMNFVLFDAGFHDLHHLNARIPCYKLRECYAELADEMTATRITWDQVIQCMNMKLWDEDRGKMVGFPTSRYLGIVSPAE